MAELSPMGLERLLDSLESIAESLKIIAENQPGPCESYIGPLLPNDPKSMVEQRTYCSLKSGHEGRHRGEDGSTWTGR